MPLPLKNLCNLAGKPFSHWGSVVDDRDGLIAKLKKALENSNADTAILLGECLDLLRGADLKTIFHYYDREQSMFSGVSRKSIPRIVIRRLHRNACALLATARAACLTGPETGTWTDLTNALNEAAYFLNGSPLRTIVPPDKWKARETSLGIACGLLRDAGVRVEGARLWTSFWLSGAADCDWSSAPQVLRVPVALVKVDGGIADLELRRIDGTDGEFIEHPLRSLRLLDFDLMKTLRQAWRRSIDGGPRPALAWGIERRDPNRGIAPLTGDSLGGAAHAACRLAASRNLYDSSCLIAAAVDRDGATLLPVGDEFEKLAAVLQNSTWKIRRVVLAPATSRAPRLVPLIENLRRNGIDVSEKRTVAEAMDVASGLITGLRDYYQDLIAQPDRVSSDFAYLGGKNLSALHVPMDVFEIEHTERKKGEDAGKGRELAWQTSARRVSWQSVVDNMKAQPASGVVLTAPGGHGKSQQWRMTLRELAEEGLRLLNNHEALDRLPLPIGLACAGLTGAAGEEALLGRVTKGFRDQNEILSRYARERIKAAKDGNADAQKQLWLVLDALDQVGAEGRLQQELKTALETIDDWNCRIVVTSRLPAFLARLAVFERMKTFKRLRKDDKRVAVEHRLAPLSSGLEGQQHEFLTKWFGSEAQADPMRRWIEGNAAAREMAEVPFLLTLMCWASDSLLGSVEELTRARLYDNIVRAMLRTWPNGNEEEEGENVDEDILPMLAETVFEIFSEYLKNGWIAHGRLLAVMKKTEEEAAPWVDGKRDPRCHRALQPKHHIEELVKKRVLLIAGKDAGKNRYEFPHRTIAEFLAACYLAEHPDGKLVKPSTEHPLKKKPGELEYEEPLPALPPLDWEEPVVMGAGLVALNEANVDHYIEDVRKYNPVIAGRCAGEVRHKIGAGLKKKLQNNLLSRLENQTVYVRARIAAADALGEIGDPRWEGLKREGPFGAYILPRMAEVPADTYWIGDDNGKHRDEKPAHPVPLPGFGIGQYAVTNMEYACFLHSPKYRDPQWWNGHLEDAKGDPEYWEDSRFNRKTQPVVGISWFEAMAYCRWLTENACKDGNGLEYRLPSEAEYEAAARGKEERQYAYGNKYDPMKANTGDHLGQTTPVGIYEATKVEGSRDGAYDLTGNVWSWTRSIFDQDRFPYPYTQKQREREDLNDRDESRILRGGSWGDGRDDARAAYRYGVRPLFRYGYLGFRVVGVVRPPSR